MLQPARFMQNFERSWNDIVEHDRLTQPYSLSAKMCSVDYRDVAEVAAIAMTGDELSYGTFELQCAGDGGQLPDGGDPQRGSRTADHRGADTVGSNSRRSYPKGHSVTA